MDLVAACAVLAVAVGLVVVARATSATSSAQRTPDVSTGRHLWLRDCAVCHRADGSGGPNGPDIRSSGTAAVDFMVSTGRMPIGSPGERATRHPPAYTPAQIRALVAYTGTFVHGPKVPRVDVTRRGLSPGLELYSQNCSTCHQAAGGGGALAFGVVAPSLAHATPVQVVEAMRTGPGAMPVFDEQSIDAKQADQISSYVQQLRAPEDPGGASLGHLGPVPEGLIAWVVGLGAMVLITRFLGSRRRDARRT